MLGSAANPFNLPRDFVPPPSAPPSQHNAAARRYIAAASSLLSTYRYLLETHPVEFLTQRPMDRLPPAWLAELPAIEHRLGLNVLSLLAEPEGEESPSRGTNGNEGLLGFFQQARRLHMPRQPSTELEVAVESAGRDPASLLQPLAQELRMFTNPKKIHEVERMSHAIVAAAHQLQCGAVLDLGAGVGRLAQCLALQYGLRVCGVDCSSDFQIKAEQRSEWLLRNRRRPGSIQQSRGEERVPFEWAGRPPLAVTARVNPGMTASDIESLWSEALAAEERRWSPEPEPEPEPELEPKPTPAEHNRLLVGLHSCGELTPTMLHIFASQVAQTAPAAVRGLVVVGCCYNLLAANPVRTLERALRMESTSGPPLKIDPMADEVVHYPLRAMTEEDVPPDSESGVSGVLLIDRRLCAAAAESTNPAFLVRQLSIRGVQSKSNSVGGREGETTVGALRPRRLARALLQRRLRDHYPETYARSTTLKLKTGGFTPFQPGSYSKFVRKALASASIDLLADSQYVPNLHAAETNQTEQKPRISPETGVRLAEQGAAGPAVSDGQSAKPERTKQHPREAEVMAALEAEWEREWAAEGGNLKLFYLMREALAPLVEAVLLVDRAVYLSERINGARRTPSAGLERDDKNPEGVVRLFPLFDPALSPRNICLFASAPEITTGATTEGPTC